MNKKFIVAINEVDFGSTGNIAVDVLNSLDDNEFDKLLVCHESLGRFSNEYIINKSKLGYLFNKIFSRFDASDGFHSKLETKKLIKKLRQRKPDLLFLNNLHGSYINLRILFNFIKENNIKCIWTLHDCWSFTGKCAHFEAVKCDKWKNGCHSCPNLKEHPRAYFFDRSKRLYNLKKKLFIGMEKYITFVTPSHWLSYVLEQSYLKDFKHIVINNGINIDNFTSKKENTFRNKNDLNKYKLILCLANVFTEKKGIFDIIKLSSLLSENEKIVLIGKLKEKIKLPKNILYFDRTNNLNELVDIYCSCDVFFNPTYEETYPTVNLEANACKLPIVCYKTSGASETVDPRFLINPGDISGSYKLIKEILEKNTKYEFLELDKLSSKSMLESYKNLFKEICKK